MGWWWWTLWKFKETHKGGGIQTTRVAPPVQVGGQVTSMPSVASMTRTHVAQSSIQHTHTQCANALSIFISCTVRAYQTKRNKAKAAANEILMNGCRLPSKWLTKKPNLHHRLPFHSISSTPSLEVTEPPSGRSKSIQNSGCNVPPLGAPVLEPGLDLSVRHFEEFGQGGAFGRRQVFLFVEPLLQLAHLRHPKFA